jgi:hypothetical protein
MLQVSWSYRTFLLAFICNNRGNREAHIACILKVILYGCETWSLTLREEHRLSVYENRELRRIFGPKREEVIGKWRKFHNEKLLICTVH